MRPLAFAAALICCSLTVANDWPGWRGADRTGVSAEKGLLKKWPTGGPKQKWKATDLGGGYSTPSVADGKVFLIGSKGQDEHVFALKLEDGSPIWNRRLGDVAQVGYAGSRCTPTIDGEELYAISSKGDLACMSVANGEVKWTKDLKDDFGGSFGGWGYAESPLIDGDLLICTPGGDSATMVCLNKSDGSTVWKTAIDGAGAAAYSSPIPVKVGNSKQYVNFLSNGLVGIDAKTGKLAWTYKRSANGTANCSTAVAQNGVVFSASGYGTGGGAVKATNKSATELYFAKEFKSHHGGFVLIGNYVYGTNDQSLLCMDFKSGKIVWSNRCVGKGSITAVDGMLIVRSEQGPVALVSATSKGYELRGKFDQPERSNENSWAYPVVANGLLLLRDQDKMFAYDVKAEK
jgi:outer membrane protein assembly factor BamB